MRTLVFEEFIQKALSPWHVATTLKTYLQELGGVLLDEKRSWDSNSLMGGQLYLVQRGATFIAFRTPKNAIEAFRLVVTHLDSPCLKLKPCPLVQRDGMNLLQLEPYGAPILPSWIGRPLKVAGVIINSREDASRELYREELVELTTRIFIPHVALHLDRSVNETGHLVQKHMHLFALAGANFLPNAQVMDLYASIDAAPQAIGPDGTLLAAPRLDNLATLFPLFKAFSTQAPSENLLQLFIAWNHEEIGSETAEGASSALVSDIVERILYSQAYLQDYSENYAARKRHLEMKAHSSVISCDVAHGFHPNYSDKNDGDHSPKLGSGVVLKTNPNQRYCYDITLAAELITKMEKYAIPYSHFSLRNDLQAGSTVGPRLAAALGVKTIDIGIPLLGMHAAQEMVAYSDMDALERLASILFD